MLPSSVHFFMNSFSQNRFAIMRKIITFARLSESRSFFIEDTCWYETCKLIKQEEQGFVQYINHKTT